MKVVLDTNVLVSAIIKRDGNSSRLLSQAGLQYEWLTCDFILSELTDVLSRKHIQTKYRPWVTPTRIKKFLIISQSLATRVKIRSQPTVAADPKDNIILACALDGRADYLVTGDPHLLSLKSVKGAHILTPAHFLLTLLST